MAEALQLLLSPLIEAGYGWVLLVAAAIIVLGLGWFVATAFRNRGDR